MTEHASGEHSEERMVLGHDPIPGYRGAFYVAVAVGLLYLLLVFTGVI